MIIYDSEKNDGLTDAINKSVAHIQSPIKTSQISMDQVLDMIKNHSVADLKSIKDLIGVDQPDLALLVSILVSTGWNLNDDVFAAEELWKAKDTPAHKPIDYNHDPKVILGHMVKSRAIDKTGNEIDSIYGPTGLAIDNFDLEVAGVLYKEMPEIGDQVREILKEANDGAMFVSMECYFDDFGYSFQNSNTGETKSIIRDEKNSFLTKHLRAYGGTGEFQGYKIGRILKNIVFGGQGLVRNPANPDSVIKIAASDKSKGGVRGMDEETKKRLEEADASILNLTTVVSAKDAQIDSLTKELETTKLTLATQEKASCDKVAEISQQLNTASETVKSLESDKLDLAKKLEEANLTVKKVNDELSKIQKAEKARERFTQLSKVKQIKDTEKESVLAELAELTDETFNTIIKYSKMEIETTKTDVAAADVKVEVVVEKTAVLQAGNEKIENDSAKVALATARCLLGITETENKKEGSEE